MNAGIRSGAIKRNPETKRYQFSSTSFDAEAIENDPTLEVSYIIAPPRMRLYEEYSSRIYATYLKYVAPEDKHPILRHGFARRCEVQLAYAIGIEEPVSVYVNTFHTGKVPAAYLVSWIRKHYDLTPAGIISSLGLRDVNYNNTATLGHFWHQWMPWEE